MVVRVNAALTKCDTLQTAVDTLHLQVQVACSTQIQYLVSQETAQDLEQSPLRQVRCSLNVLARQNAVMLLLLLAWLMDAIRVPAAHLRVLSVQTDSTQSIGIGVL